MEVQLRVKCGEYSMATRSREITDTGATDFEKYGHGISLSVGGRNKITDLESLYLLIILRSDRMN